VPPLRRRRIPGQRRRRGVGAGQPALRRPHRLPTPAGRGGAGGGCGRGRAAGSWSAAKKCERSFLCLITPLCSYLYGGLYGGLYERAHIIRYRGELVGSEEVREVVDEHDRVHGVVQAGVGHRPEGGLRWPRGRVCH
jgi:hypothetical protein